MPDKKDANAEGVALKIPESSDRHADGVAVAAQDASTPESKSGQKATNKEKS